MPATATEALQEFLADEVGDAVRMIARYDVNGYEVVFRREDVTHDVDMAVEDHRLEALSTDHFRRLFGPGHGDLTCIVKCFEDAVEMNFPLSKTHGVGVSLDAAAMAESKLFVGACRDVLEPYADLGADR
jgi:hypothetical protein